PKADFSYGLKSGSIDSGWVTEKPIWCRLTGFFGDQKEGPENQTMLVREEIKDLKELRIPEWTMGLRVPKVYWDFHPRGGIQIGDERWTKKSPPNHIERSHALLGRTVDVGRLWDTAATAHALEEAQLVLLMTIKGKRKLTVIGHGQAGVLAAYAAMFEPSIIG